MEKYERIHEVMMVGNWYSPQLRGKPKRLPRRLPLKTIPSGLGDEGIVGSWLMCYMRGGDHLHDFSPYENHGTLTSANADRPIWVEGRWGWALDHDGVDDYVEIPTFSTFSEFTVIVWSKHRSVGDGDNDSDFTIRDNNGIIMRDEGDGSYSVYIYDGVWNSVSTDITNGVWNCWAARYDGSVFEGFKNGSSFGTYSTTAYRAVGADIHGIGARAPTSPGEFLNGVVAIVWLYDKAKTDTYIDLMFQRTRSLFGV